MNKAINRLNSVVKEREKMVYEILSGKKYGDMRTCNSEMRGNMEAIFWRGYLIPSPYTGWAYQYKKISFLYD